MPRPTPKQLVDLYNYFKALTKSGAKLTRAEVEEQANSSLPFKVTPWYVKSYAKDVGYEFAPDTRGAGAYKEKYEELEVRTEELEEAIQHHDDVLKRQEDALKHLYQQLGVPYPAAPPTDP